MLRVRERVDDWFTARVVDGARNLAELKGVIAGDAISWHEAVPLPGWGVDIQGKWQSDQFRFAYVAKTRDGVKTREGDGALTYFPPFDSDSPATTPPDEAAASFVAGSVWKGWRWYERASVLQGTVSFELHVQQRVGNKFSGFVFDNGTGRNKADVKGEIRGKTIVWEERPQHMKAVVTSCGLLDANRIQVIFDGVYPDRPREGSAELRRVAPAE